MQNLLMSGKLLSVYGLDIVESIKQGAIAVIEMLTIFVVNLFVTVILSFGLTILDIFSRLFSDGGSVSVDGVNHQTLGFDEFFFVQIFNSSGLLDNFYNVFVVIGGVLVLFFLVVCLVQNLVIPLGIEAEAPPQVVLKTLIVFPLLFFSKDIISIFILKIFKLVATDNDFKNLLSFEMSKTEVSNQLRAFVKVPQYMLERFLNLGTVSRQYTSEVISTMGFDDIGAFSDILDVVKAVADNVLGTIVASAIVVIILYMILFNMVRLILEIYERYALLILLMFTSPLAMATLVSKSASGIAKKFFSMVFAQCLLIIFNIFSVKLVYTAFEGISYFADESIDSTGFVCLAGCFLMVAFLRLAQKFDSYLNQLGVNAGITGGLGADLIAMSHTAGKHFGSMTSIPKKAVDKAKSAGKTVGNIQQAAQRAGDRREARQERAEQKAFRDEHKANANSGNSSGATSGGTATNRSAGTTSSGDSSASDTGSSGGSGVGAAVAGAAVTAGRAVNHASNSANGKSENNAGGRSATNKSMNRGSSGRNHSSSENANSVNANPVNTSVSGSSNEGTGNSSKANSNEGGASQPANTESFGSSGSGEGYNSDGSFSYSFSDGGSSVDTGDFTGSYSEPNYDDYGDYGSSDFFNDYPINDADAPPERNGSSYSTYSTSESSSSTSESTNFSASTSETAFQNVQSTTTDVVNMSSSGNAQSTTVNTPAHTDLSYTPSTTPIENAPLKFSVDGTGRSQSNSKPTNPKGRRK